jgi:hypothetical protein
MIFYTHKTHVIFVLQKETLFGRNGFPDELKGAILFLCTQASGWYPGQDLLVDAALALENIQLRLYREVC